MPLEAVTVFDHINSFHQDTIAIEDDAPGDEYTWINNNLRVPRWYIDKYIRLWVAVLCQAISDVYKPKDYRDKDDYYKIKKEAHRWFLSDDWYIGSYLFICEAVDLDPWYWRKRVLCLDINRDYYHKCMNEFKRRYDRKIKGKGYVGVFEARKIKREKKNGD